MTTKAQKLELLDEYFTHIAPLKAKAEKAFGSRATDSDNHEVSKQYTDLLVEYTDKGGSLLLLAEALEVTYPALRRRVATANVAPLTRHTRSKANTKQYNEAVEIIQPLRNSKNTVAYHDAIKVAYDKGLSINKLASYLGLKSAYPLYYGLNKARMRSGEGVK